MTAPIRKYIKALIPIRLFNGALWMEEEDINRLTEAQFNSEEIQDAIDNDYLIEVNENDLPVDVVSPHLKFKGGWDASNNALPIGRRIGDVYKVIGQGTIDEITVLVDQLVFFRTLYSFDILGNSMLESVIPRSEKGQALGVATLDANGLVPVNQMSPFVVERVVVVANEAARFALTINQVQNGDVVNQQNPEPSFFYVIDDENLDNESGYLPFASGIAASVAWSGISDIPNTVTQVGNLEGHGVFVLRNDGSVASREVTGSDGVQVSEGFGEDGNINISLVSGIIEPESYGGDEIFLTLRIDTYGRTTSVAAVASSLNKLYELFNEEGISKEVPLQVGKRYRTAGQQTPYASGTAVYLPHATEDALGNANSKPIELILGRVVVDDGYLRITPQDEEILIRTSIDGVGISSPLPYVDVPNFCKVQCYMAGTGFWFLNVDYDSTHLDAGFTALMSPNDFTKRLKFLLENIDTGQTRNITMPDRDVDLGLVFDPSYKELYKTDTTYTVEASDVTREGVIQLVLTNAANIACTLPLPSDLGTSPGFNVTIIQGAAGIVTVTADAFVGAKTTATTAVFVKEGEAKTFTVVDANTWRVFGA